MKKFTKGMLIAAGIFGAVGIGLTAAGGVMGASMSELTGVESLKRVLLVADGDYDYDDSDDYDDDDDYDDSDDYDYDDSDDYDGDDYDGDDYDDDDYDDSGDYDDSDDCDDSEDYVRAVDENEEDGTVYQLKYQPTKLDIELKYDELILEEGDSFCVRVYDDSGKNVTVKESSDTLKVRSTKKLSKTRKVCISYPEDVKLQELEIEMGAGTVYLNRDIETEKLSVEMGAGEFESKNPVTAREADLEIGTGSMTFADLSARKTDGECGLGELDLTLTGTQEDYNYDLECGVGNLDVGSDSYSGLGREKSISNTGADRKVVLECGMGNVSVDFSGKEHRNLQTS